MPDYESGFDLPDRWERTLEEGRIIGYTYEDRDVYLSVRKGIWHVEVWEDFGDGKIQLFSAGVDEERFAGIFVLSVMRMYDILVTELGEGESGGWSQFVS